LPAKRKGAKKNREILKNSSNGENFKSSRNSISDMEKSKISHLNYEIGHLSSHKNRLQRELALVTADLIRKEDELRSIFGSMAEKYDLKKGVREVNIRTGEIVERK